MRSGLTLVFNGEIYNYRELRAELVAAGHAFTSATDSEVLLHLYERDGLDMLEAAQRHLRVRASTTRARRAGPTASNAARCSWRAIIWASSRSTTRRLERGFLFASEIKALLHERSLSREVDPTALHQMLAYLWTPAPRTMLRSVRKLEPGSALLVHDGRVRRQWSYYTMPYDGQSSTSARPTRSLASWPIGSRRPCVASWSPTCRSAHSCRAVWIRARSWR